MTAARPAETTERVRLDVDGMTCASCAARVEKKLSRVEGVEESSVNYATEEATVVYDPTRVEVDDLLEAVSAAGYSAHVHGEAAREGTSVLRRGSWSPSR